VVTVKYLAFVMQADHHGEGGIFALLAVVPQRFRAAAAHSGKVTGMALLAVIGAALLYGDGVITPAISVLSAVEGLAVASPRLSPLVVPLTCVILAWLFAIQRRGTGDVGYMEEPLLLPVLRGVSRIGAIPFDVDDATYYIGHETIMAKKGGLHRIPEAIFSYLNRNAVQEERRYGMPAGQVVEIGTQIYL
jgi:K+ transporter